ncbi:GTP-binding protein [Nakamurella leprariae]|uniref:GTP-binding protein n=1 Tax=Nakamurella leprariae TaxID=2803911 RepID=A0A938YHK3_9ACTN|nr:GTP-binding protein [Nakamurella leprariae]MBM9468487.1 GTP-binding protein [Nakamurella leprariae]
MTVPVVVLSGIDPVLLEVAGGALLVDLPGAVLLRHEVDARSGRLRRVLGDLGGVQEDQRIDLSDGCAGCATTSHTVHDLATLVRHRRSGPPTAVVVQLPVGAAPLGLAGQLDTASLAAELGVHLAAVVSLVDLDRAVADLLGTALMADHDRQLCPTDARSVSHALSAQLTPADLVLTSGGSPTGRALVDQLRAADSERADLLHAGPESLLRRHRRPGTAARRADLRELPAGAPTQDGGIWTITLRSRRPLHPQRWRLIAESLHDAPVRSRGCFALPTRPEQSCAWDAAGGQLLVRGLGGWDGAPARTQLSFTGVQGERPRITAAFERALLTDDELAAHPRAWSDVDDGLDPWLGLREQVV